MIDDEGVARIQIHRVRDSSNQRCLAFRNISDSISNEVVSTTGKAY